MNENVRLALLAEQKIKEVTQEIVNEIDRNIINSKNNKVKELAPNMIVVKFSDLDKGRLDPDNYIMSAQARYVKEYLANSKSISVMMNRIREIVTNGYVVSNSRKFRLNVHTLSVIEEYAKNNLEMSFDV